MFISPEQTKIGWIGTGVMGASMCGHLLGAGYQVTLTTRTRSKAEGLLERGALWADSPQEVAQQADLICTIVGYPRDVEEVIFGERGVLQGAASGAILVDMTTSRPALAERIFAAAQEQGIEAMDAPVSGGDIGAREARLSIMIGGNQATATRLQPFWECLGKTWVYQGPAGAGQHTKMVNQTLIAAGMVAVCEGLLYAQ